MKKLSIIIGLIISSILLIVLLNYIVNPFKVFKTAGLWSNNANSYARYSIAPKLKMTKNNHYDYILFGASNTHSYYDESISTKLNKDILDITLEGLNYKEMSELVDFLTTIYPNDSKLLISLEYDTASQDIKSDLPKLKGKNLNFDELKFLLFSKTAINCSLEAIILYFKNIKLFQKMSNCHTLRRQPHFRYDNYWKSHKMTKKNLDLISTIANITKERQFNTIFFVNPDHAYILAELYLDGMYPYVENFKRELVNITPFYDFLYINEYNTAPVSLENPYWFNVLHAESNLGNIIFKQLIQKEGSLGIYVTKNNIEDVLIKERKKLINYVKTHKSEIEQFRTYQNYDLYEEEKTTCH